MRGLCLLFAACAPEPKERPEARSTAPLDDTGPTTAGTDTTPAAVAGPEAALSPLPEVLPGMARFVIVGQEPGYDTDFRAMGCGDFNVVGSLDGDPTRDLAWQCGFGGGNTSQGVTSTNWWLDIDTLEPGVHRLEQVATQSWNCESGPPVDAGDLNHDGMDDIWFGGVLFLSPHTNIPRQCGTADEAIDNPSYFQTAIGNIDVDEDGHLDLIVAVSPGAVVYYGPFPRPANNMLDYLHPAFHYTEDTLIFTDCSYGGQPISLRGDLLGPGTRTLGFATAASWYSCDNSLDYLVDLNDRGRAKYVYVGEPRTQVVANVWDIRPLGGDWDKDGFDDYANFFNLMAGPIDLNLREGGYYRHVGHYPGQFLNGLGPDVTGDGIPEIILTVPGSVVPNRPHSATTYLVPSGAELTSHEDVEALGIRLTTLGFDLSGPFPDDIVVADIDGNGVEDLIIRSSIVGERAPSGNITFTRDAWHIWLDQDLQFPPQPTTP